MKNQKHSGLYLLIRKNILNEGKNIYKIGKSTNLCKRVYDYPNLSQLYLIILCDDINKHEKALIKLFSSKFVLERTYGIEYFSGNLVDMINEMILYMQNHITRHCKIEFRDGIELTYCIENNISTKTLYKYFQNIVYIENTILNNNFISNENPYKCPCGNSFPQHYLLLRHQSGTRGCSYTKSINNCDNNINNDTENKCETCNKTLSDKYKLKRHKKTCNKKEELKMQSEDAYAKLIMSSLDDILNDLDIKRKQILINLLKLYNTDNKAKEILYKAVIDFENNIINKSKSL